MSSETQALSVALVTCAEQVTGFSPVLRMWLLCLQHRVPFLLVERVGSQHLPAILSTRHSHSHPPARTAPSLLRQAGKLGALGAHTSAPNKTRRTQGRQLAVSNQKKKKKELTEPNAGKRETKSKSTKPSPADVAIRAGRLREALGRGEGCH